MKKVIVTVMSLIFAALLVFATASCGGGGKNEPTPTPNPTTTPTLTPAVRPDYLRLSAEPPHTLDPAKVTDIGSHSYVANIFSGLLALEPVLVEKTTGRIVAQGDNVFIPEYSKGWREGKYAWGEERAVPDIAEAIPEPVYNPDGTISYIFKIKQGVKFHSGEQREVTAYDFAYSLDRAVDPRTHSTSAEQYLGDILGVKEMLFAEQGRLYQGKKLINRDPVVDDISKTAVDLPGIEVLDKYALKITTYDVLPELFYKNITYPTSWVVDKFNVKAEDWEKRPNGTGPYRVIKKEPGEIALVASDVYYKQAPKIKKIVYYLGGSDTFIDYREGNRDLSGIDLDYFDEVRNPASEWKNQYFQNIDMSTSYLGLNTQIKPFDDAKVRQAFTMAIDKEAIAKSLLKGASVVAYGILPPGMPGFQDLTGLRFDPERARQLLKESKYGGPTGLGTVKLATSSGAGGSPSKVLQFMLQMWEENLGVKVILDSRDYALFLEDLGKSNFQMFSMGWIADYPDPENFLDLKFRSTRSAANNSTLYNNPAVDKLLDLARKERNPDKRIEIYQQAERIIVEDAVWLPLFYGQEHVLVKPYVQNYLPTRMGIPVLRYLSFAE